MFAVRYTAAAKRDLREITTYVRQEAGDVTARRLVERLRAKISKLSQDGLRYRERKELGEGRRAILIGPYIAFYRVIDDVVFVQRILHGARDITIGMFKP
jgi:toxin ParE1/3/4